MFKSINSQADSYQFTELELIETHTHRFILDLFFFLLIILILNTTDCPNTETTPGDLTEIHQ